MARPERLERKTRRLAAIGGRIPKSTLAKARAKEASIAARMNQSFERADVVLCPIAGGPPPRIADVAERELKHHYGHIYRFVRRRTHDHDRAEELTQQVFADAATSLDGSTSPTLAVISGAHGAAPSATAW